MGSEEGRVEDTEHSTRRDPRPRKRPECTATPRSTPSQIPKIRPTPPLSEEGTVRTRKRTVHTKRDLSTKIGFRPSFSVLPETPHERTVPRQTCRRNEKWVEIVVLLCRRSGVSQSWLSGKDPCVYTQTWNLEKDRTSFLILRNRRRPTTPTNCLTVFWSYKSTFYISKRTRHRLTLT